MYNKKILIDALKKLGSAKAPTQKKDIVVGSNNPTEMLAMQKGFSPYDKKLNVKKSNIHGKGLFTEQPLKKGELIGLAHVNNQPTPIVGNFHNHSENNATALNIRRGNQRYLVAAKDLEPGTEITTNYRLQPELGQPEDFPHSINETPTARRGGSTPKLPNKKNSRAYSRSLDATNRLFAEHPWFKKSKSRKNKIYDPNSPYFQPGGETDLPQNVGITYLSGDDRSHYSPLDDTIYLNPNASDSELNHELVHAWQNRTGRLRSNPNLPQQRPPIVASDKQAASYYTRKGDDVDYYLNNLSTLYPNLTDGNIWTEDLNRFMPEQIKYDKVIEPLMYLDPNTMEGEAEMFSQVYGPPPGISFRKKGGALPKAQDGTVWVKDENDPRYKDYLIRQGLYNYSNNPNFNVRDIGTFDLYDLISSNKLEDLKKYDDVYYDNRVSKILSKELKPDADEYARVFREGLKDPNVGPYGSVVNYQTIPNEKLHLDPDYQNAYFYLKDLEANNNFFKQYPPTEWQKKQYYESHPFGSTFAYYNSGQNEIYTTPNTLFIEDEINRNALKQVYPNLTDLEIDKIISERRKEPAFITNNRDSWGFEEHADTYDFITDPLGRIKSAEPQYIADPNKETFIDKKGRLGYLQESIRDNIRQSFDYLPVWPKPETTVKVLPPPIEIKPGSLRVDHGKLPELQPGNFFSEPLPEAPQYALDPYTDNRLSVDIKLPQNQIKHMFDSGVLSSKGHFNIGKKNKTKLIPRIVQKFTGYDPKYFEGYENEEGEYIPGELEIANELGNKVEFKGAASLRDYMNQQKYAKEYEEYEKKLDEWNEKYEQSRKKQAEGRAFKKGGSLLKAQYGFTGFGKDRALTASPFDFRTSYGQVTDFYKNPNYSLTYTTPNLFKKTSMSANPLSFTIGRPYYTDTQRLTHPSLDTDAIYRQDYYDPAYHATSGSEYQQYLQDVSDYSGVPVSGLNQTLLNKYNAAQNLAAVKPTYKKGIPLTANVDYSLFGNLPGKSGAGALAGALTLGAGYAPEPGFYGTMDASAYGIFGKRKHNKTTNAHHYFNTGLTRQGDRAWIPRLNIFNAVVKQRPEYNDAQTQKILELYKEDIEKGTTTAEDFMADNVDQSSGDPFNISVLSPELTFQVKPFKKIPGILSLTAGLRNTLGGKDKSETTVGGQWTPRPYGNIRYSVPVEDAIDRLKDLDLPPVKKRKSYYDYVNENEQTDDTNETPPDNTFPPEDTSTDENTMQPSYDGEGVGKGPCPKGYERLCEECRCTKIQTRRSPLLDKRGIHPYIDGQYLEDGGITVDLTPEEIEEYAKGGYIIEDISIPSLNKMKNGGLEWPPKRLSGQASRALEIIREPEIISTYLGQTTPNLRLPSLRSINIDQFKNLDQWDLKNRKLIYPFKIEAPSGVLEIKPHDYSNIDQNLWELYANMPNQIEAGRAFYMLNQMLQPEPTILQRDSLSSDSLNTMLSVGNKKDWDAEYVGDLPFNFMGRNNQIFKGLNIPTYAPTGVSTPLGEQMVERLNSFIKDKGYGDEAYIANVPGFPRASVYVPNYRLKRRWKNGGEFKKYQPGGQINAIKAIEELRNLKPIRNIGSFQIAPFKTPVFKIPDIKLPDIKMPAVTVASTFIPTISPKDWSKNWNKATGDFQGLMKEYADIEQRTKADNTWMKNADGSPYQGSEYEFIQEQSEPFKKAFPEGFNQVFRGVNKKTAFRDFSRGKKLSGDRAMFTGDYLVGDDYAKFHSRQDNNNILTPFVQDNVTGLYNLIYPKGKEVIYNAGGDFWSNIGSGISDFNSNALLSEFELETTKRLLNARLERLLELQKNNPSNFLKNEIADIQNRFLLLNNNETAFNRIMPGTDLEQLRILNSELKPPTKNDNLDILDRVTTNTLAEAISRTGLNSVILQNVVDGPFGDVHIVNNRPGNYLKSKIGNQGFFKQTPGAGSNIYHKMGGESNYELGDEVDEATMKQLKELGYTFEKI